MNAVVSQGPIAISVAAEAWEMYGGGVFSDDCGWTVDHAVQVCLVTHIALKLRKRMR